ncbi:MAG: cold shock domain-containing protein [Actinobacteria bacterium]|jgi:CspA family cold shock protein|nr:cold shock domain-containing protein [Actinomycetota bacterium]
MPTGKVRWYDVDKGFGFLATDDGEDVFVHASALPAGTTSLKQGARVEFGIVDGKRGKQALSVTILEQPASIVKAGRKPAEDVAVILEDLIKLMDSASNQLRRGRYPSDDHCRKLAAVMRAVADDFDV